MDREDCYDYLPWHSGNLSITTDDYRKWVSSTRQQIQRLDSRLRGNDDELRLTNCRSEAISRHPRRLHFNFDKPAFAHQVRHLHKGPHRLHRIFFSAEEREVGLVEAFEVEHAVCSRDAEHAHLHDVRHL